MTVATVATVSRAHLVFDRLATLGNPVAPGNLEDRLDGERLTLELPLSTWERLIDLAEQALG